MEYIRTPVEIWEQLSKEFNFTVDACASDKNHLLPKYWTKENSALDKNWDKKHKPQNNIKIRFLPAPNVKNGKTFGYKFLTDDYKEPKYGYLRPLMIVVVDNK